MTCYRGNDGVLKVGATAVGEVVEWNAEESTSLHDCTSMGDDWERHTPGIKKWTASVTLRWDKDDAGQNALEVGGSVSVKLYPAGDGAGGEVMEGTATVETISVSVSKDDLVERSVSLTGNGALTHGTV